MRGGRLSAALLRFRMAIVKQKAYAKINLTLEVLGIEAGYHALDSLVVSVDLFDQITIKTRKDEKITVKMRGMDSENIPETQNNAYKAAKLFQEKYAVQGVDILIDKNIPMGAGLGGSSADVGGVLNGLAELYKIEDEKGLDEIAAALGSDTVYMRKGGLARMQGRGTRVYYFGMDKPLYFLLICPTEGVSTKACFDKFDALGRAGGTGATSRAIDAYVKGDMEALGKNLYNDLFAPARQLNTKIQAAYEEAESFAPLGVTMTGAGSCVVALFENETFCQYAKSRYRGDGLCLIAKTVAECK